MLKIRKIARLVDEIILFSKKDLEENIHFYIFADENPKLLLK